MSPNKAGDDLYFCRVFFVLSPLSFEEEEFVKNVLTRQLCLSLLTISVLIPPWHSPLHTLTSHFLCLRGLKTDATGRQRLPPRDRWDSLQSTVTGLWWAATSRGVQRASVHLLSLLYQGAHPNWSLVFQLVEMSPYIRSIDYEECDIDLFDLIGKKHFKLYLVSIWRFWRDLIILVVTVHWTIFLGKLVHKPG